MHWFYNSYKLLFWMEINKSESPKNKTMILIFENHSKFTKFLHALKYNPPAHSYTIIYIHVHVL